MRKHQFEEETRVNNDNLASMEADNTEGFDFFGRDEELEDLWANVLRELLGQDFTMEGDGDDYNERRKMGLYDDDDIDIEDII